MAQANKKCQICKEIGHSKFYCRKKPYKPIPKISRKKLLNPTTPKVYKPIKKIGKKGNQWIKTKADWKKQNPPDDYGYWYCKVGGYRLTDDQENLEYAFPLNVCHDRSRVRHPHLAFELSNLFAGCPLHNREQGSMDLEEYLTKNPSKKCGNL